MRESGLRAQEQIRVKKDSGRVLIQRVPSDMKVSWVKSGCMASVMQSQAGV